MPRILLLVLCGLLLFPTTGVLAQSTTPIPEPPVRYDEDVLLPSFHQERRAAVLAQLPENAVAIFFSEPVRVRENDVDFEYRQSSDLYYLTGTHEPETVLVLAPAGISVDGTTTTELLLVPPRSAYTEVWVGRRYGTERAEKELGIQKAVSNERYEEILMPLLQDSARRFYHLPLPVALDKNSTLGEQIGIFKTYAPPIEVSGNWMVQRTVGFMLSASSQEEFARIQPFIKARVNPEAFAGAELEAAYHAFVEADSYETWATWRRANLDSEHPDGTTLRNVLDNLRMVKADAEMELLQRAIDITTSAHIEVMKSIEPGMYEYEIEALIQYIFHRNGAEYTGFPSIVGSGENSVILHYNTNRRRMQADDMVVIDIGAEYRGYTADVTRSLPVNGVFSREQKTIYELVLKAQKAGIEASQSGSAFGAPGQAAQRVIAEGLRELGLIEKEEDVRNFFMHGTSHYLGLYVHDVGNGGPLVPGTVITVEPGIYIKASEDVDPKWWNIGVRIEDDVLITEDGPVVLSADAPRTVSEIEALMRETGLGNASNGVVPRNQAEQPTQGG